MRQNKSELPPKRKIQTAWFLLLFIWLVPAMGAAETRTIIFFGDSITAGYGLDPDEAYPALVQGKIREAGIPARVVNAGLSGETTAGGLRRLDWILRQPVDVFVIELGANDGLRGLAPASSQSNLQAIIDRVRQRHPETKIVLGGMRLPPNFGAEFTEKFAAIFPKLAETNHLTLIPFLLEGVGGIPALNQADGIHPNQRGHEIIADTVWAAVKPLL